MGKLTSEFARHLFDTYERHRVSGFESRRFNARHLGAALGGVIQNSDGLLGVRAAGASFEGREIQLVSAGNGKTALLFWTQMHGDESTATMAVTDLLAYLVAARQEEPAAKILSSLTLHIVLMLNPDGAEWFRRRTSQLIDMNRDALALVTPEARILKNLREELRPVYGFNLHDQELSTVGTSKDLSAIALLAPACDAEKSNNLVRSRAKRLAGTFADVMKLFVPGRLTRYDDTFEPRAFGDNMQKWGTSTLLVESGHAAGDPEKQSIRKLNFVGLLASCYAIATGEVDQGDVEAYEPLPFNGKKAYDVILRNATIDHGGGLKTAADIAVSYQVDTHTEETPRLADVGDLSTYTGLREVDAQSVHVDPAKLLLGSPFPWETYLR